MFRQVLPLFFLIGRFLGELEGDAKCSSAQSERLADNFRFEGRCRIEGTDEAARQHTSQFLHRIVGVQLDRRMPVLNTQERGGESTRGSRIDLYLQISAARLNRMDHERQRRQTLGFRETHDFKRVSHQVFEDRFGVSFSCWHGAP